MLEIDNLSVEYKKDQPVLNIIKFRLDKGEKIVILGPNGSGKTTLIRAILGLVKSKGIVKINGRTLKEIKCDLSVSANLEEIYSLLYLNVRDLISLYADLKACDEKHILDYIRSFGHMDIFDKKLWQLSTGQRKLLTNILTIASGGKMLLFDEVFDGVDPPRKLKLARILNEIEASILLTTHELGMLKHFEHWGLYFMFDGHLFGKITPLSKILDTGIVMGYESNAIITLKAANKELSLVPKAGRPLRDFMDLNVLYEELVMS
ncbi:MAG: ATP-binding cassette domain-containing protein [Candidatus Bathyarchaeia archaeon]